MKKPRYLNVLHGGLLSAFVLLSPCLGASTGEQEWSVEDLVFMLRARDHALADLAIPFEVNYTTSEDCDYRESGWWFRTEGSCGLIVQAGCLQRPPALEWTVWDGSRTREADGRGEWADGRPALEPVPESSLVRMHVMRTSSGGRLSEPVLPGEFGLNLLNHPWSSYLPGMHGVTIRGERVVAGRACIEVLFDMDAETGPDRLGFPWLVCFDKQTLLAVRLEGFERFEDGQLEFAARGLEGEPDFVELGGERWIGTRLTEVLDQAQVAPGAFIATRGRFRQGPVWDGLEIAMSVDVEDVVLDAARIAPLLEVRAREDAAVRDETLMPVGDVSDSAATNVRESEQLARLLVELGEPAPDQRVEPFSESFYEASALYFVHRMEGGRAGLDEVLQSFPVQDRVRKNPPVARTRDVARALGLHSLVLDELPGGELSQEAWLLARLVGQDDPDAIVGSVVARREGDRVRVVGSRWTMVLMDPSDFLAAVDGPVLVLSSEALASGAGVGLRGAMLAAGLALVAAGAVGGLLGRLRRPALRVAGHGEGAA